MKFNNLYEELMSKLKSPTSKISKTVTPNDKKNDYEFDLGRTATDGDNRRIDQAMSKFKGDTSDSNAISNHLKSHGITVKSVRKKAPSTTGARPTDATGLQGNPVNKDQEGQGEQ